MGLSLAPVPQRLEGLTCMLHCFFQFPDACSKFKLEKLSSSESKFLGALILQQPLDYAVRPFYQLQLSASVSNYASSWHKLLTTITMNYCFKLSSHIMFCKCLASFLKTYNYHNTNNKIIWGQMIATVLLPNFLLKEP